MYALTRDGNIENGIYAVPDDEGNTVVEFFVNEDDVMCYNVHLEAVDDGLVVTKTPDEGIDKLCNMMGYAYSIIEPGTVVVPKIETLQYDLK